MVLSDFMLRRGIKSATAADTFSGFLNNNY